MTTELPVIGSSAIDSPAPVGGSTVSRWSDWLGMTAAIGCAIHCAAMPFVIAYLPSLGLSFLADEGFHKWMAVGCFVIALSAFVPGYRRHRRLMPALIGTGGLAMISLAAFVTPDDCCAGGHCRLSQAALPDDADQADAQSQCCPHDHSTESVDSPVLVAPHDAAVHAQADCSKCEHENGSVPKSGQLRDSSASVAAAPPVSPSGFGFLLSWLTPLGGCILVTAHLLNRHQCSCCNS